MPGPVLKLRQGKFFEIIKALKWKIISIDTDNGNVINRISMDINLFDKNLTDKIKRFLPL